MYLFNQLVGFLEAIGGSLFAVVILIMLLLVIIVFVLGVVDYITNETAQKFFEPVKQEIDKEATNYVRSADKGSNTRNKRS